jgi:hypothetical protein
MIGLTGVRVEHIEGAGRALIASRSFEAGDLVLQEVPALQWAKDTPADLIASFLSVSASAQAAILDTARTVPQEAAKSQRALARTKLALQLAQSYDGPRVLDLVEALLSISDLNAHSFEGGMAIFMTASKANHSCDPNCGHSTKVDGELRYYATRAIAEGQSITISYLDGAWSMSRAARQSVLLEQKLFDCACLRCSGPDNCRGVACTDSACGGRAVCYNNASWQCKLCGTLTQPASMCLAVEEELTLAAAAIQKGALRCTVSHLDSVIASVRERLSPTHNLAVALLQAHSPRDGSDAAVQMLATLECTAVGCQSLGCTRIGVSAHAPCPALVGEAVTAFLVCHRKGKDKMKAAASIALAAAIGGRYLPWATLQFGAHDPAVRIMEDVCRKGRETATVETPAAETTAAETPAAKTMTVDSGGGAFESAKDVIAGLSEVQCGELEGLLATRRREIVVATNRIPVPRAVDCSAVRFATQFRSTMPCVFSGLVSHWPACGDGAMWGRRDKLVELLGGGSSELRVQVSPDNHIFPAVYRRGADTIRMSAAQVADATLFAPPAAEAPAVEPQKIYCKCSVPTQLGDHGLPESVFGVQTTSGPTTAGETTFWMGSAGVVTPLHFDHCHTVIAQVVGRKRVTVCPPSSNNHLYPHSVASGAPRTSRVDLHAWNRADPREMALHPEVRHASQLECILCPGDVIYIPPSWWHHVEGLEGNVSVLLPFDMDPAEQRALLRPWSEPGWGSIPSCEADAVAATAAVTAAAVLALAAVVAGRAAKTDPAVIAAAAPATAAALAVTVAAAAAAAAATAASNAAAVAAATTVSTPSSVAAAAAVALAVTVAAEAAAAAAVIASELLVSVAAAAVAASLVTVAPDAIDQPSKM